MEAGKNADCIGCFAGHTCEQADAEQAYIQAELKGDPTWVLLPEEIWTDEWKELYKGRRPIVQMVKALYGHPDAGTYWEQHLHKALLRSGFEAIDKSSWPSCYIHPKLDLVPICVR